MKTTLLFVLTLSGLPVLSAQPKYHYVKISKTWTEAQSYCRESFSDLATVKNQADHDKLLRVLKDGKRNIWIGLYDNVTKWKWVMGNVDFNNDTDFSNWQSSEPVIQPYNWSCAVMTPNGLWHSSTCNEKNPVVCYRENRHPKYILEAKKRTWNEARNHCKSKYTDLVTVTRMPKNERIASLLKEKTWIGLHRKHWSHWSDRSQRTFTKWHKGQPDNFGKNRAACAVINTQTSTWRDDSCEARHYFVCQKAGDRHKTRLKLKFQSEADLSDPAVQQQILEQLHAKLEKHELPDFKLRWIETDGKTFRKVEEKKEEEGLDDLNM